MWFVINGQNLKAAPKLQQNCSLLQNLRDSMFQHLERRAAALHVHKLFWFHASLSSFQRITGALLLYPDFPQCIHELSVEIRSSISWLESAQTPDWDWTPETDGSMMRGKYGGDLQRLWPGLRLQGQERELDNNGIKTFLWIEKGASRRSVLRYRVVL